MEKLIRVGAEKGNSWGVIVMMAGHMAFCADKTLSLRAEQGQHAGLQRQQHS